MLLSAEVSLPDTVFVHEYLTANGEKISKSAGNAEDPAEIAAEYGTDALRWWMLSDVARFGDTDYTAPRLVSRANEDLANNIGNLVNRTVSMVHRYRNGVVPSSGADPAGVSDLRQGRAVAGQATGDALAEFDFRRAVSVVTAIGDQANRYIESVRPWELAKAERVGGEATSSLDGVLAELIATCRDIAELLTPFLPATAARIAAQCTPHAGSIPEPRPVFPRLEVTS